MRTRSVGEAIASLIAGNQNDNFRGLTNTAPRRRTLNHKANGQNSNLRMLATEIFRCAATSSMAIFWMYGLTSSIKQVDIWHPLVAVEAVIGVFIL